MKPSDIKEGATYRNRGKGTTTRKVIGIGNEHRPVRWLGGYEKNGDRRLPPEEPGVLYYQADLGRRGNLYLSSFASWAGSEVEASE